jgi:DNA (cytosine-5)-methyltransferase 1
MIRPAYYNEIDPYLCDWLRNLIAAGLIPPGDVDDRDIRSVCADDLRGYRQCHFFAGIGGFAYACRLAGWPDDEEIWTGGFPCQPFSVAGRQRAQADDRHLWPELHRLIASARPALFLGENVSGLIPLGLDGVLSDLESEGYASRAVVVPACAVNAPHRRDRVWIVGHRLADRDGERPGETRQLCGRATQWSAGRSEGGLEHARASDGAKGSPGQRFGSGTMLPLPAQAVWATPTTRDHKDASSIGSAPENALLGRQVKPSPDGGYLNPEFVFWLMGYPPEFVACAPPAMRLSRRSPQKSSAPSASDAAPVRSAGVDSPSAGVGEAGVARVVVALRPDVQINAGGRAPQCIDHRAP